MLPIQYIAQMGEQTKVEFTDKIMPETCPHTILPVLCYLL
jgi:hypothetical protein